MNLATQYQTAPDFIPTSPKRDLQIGYDLYVAREPIEACKTHLQVQGWWAANKAEAMATMPVGAQ